MIGVSKIKKTSKAVYILFGIIDALLILAAALLLIISFAFSGGGAPSLFGHNIFVVETDAFSLIEEGSALITEKVPYSEISAGNIIIYIDEENTPFVGEVQQVSSEAEVYTFLIKDDAGNEVVVGQSKVIGKGIYYSPIIGKLVSFVLSPMGIFLIAVLPCAAFLIFELISAARRRAPQPEVGTVRKQEEIPTFVPEAAKRHDIDDRDDDEQEKPVFKSERQKLMDAAGLFTQPIGKKPVAYEPSAPKQETRTPVTEREIERLIRETKAKYAKDPFFANAEDTESHEPRKRPEPRTVTSRQAAAAYSRTVAQAEKASREHREYSPERKSASVPEKAPDEEEIVKPYVPKALSYSASRQAPRVSRLDSLLREEPADSNYDIDDILQDIEHKEG